MNLWDEAVSAAKIRFVEMLQSEGFCWTGSDLKGDVEGAAGPVLIRIELGEFFPFTPPHVFPPKEFPMSWHREISGAMCLYPSEGRESLPWLVEGDLIAMIRRWLIESESGWPGDFPVLDLERYFPTAREQKLIIYDDLEQVENQFVKLKRYKNYTKVEGPGSIPRGAQSKFKRDRAFGYISSIGELDSPPRSWSEIRKLLPESDVKRIEKGVQGKQFDYLIFKYSREDKDAVVALAAQATMSGELVLTSVDSASQSPESLTLRAGAKARELHKSRVVVVGAGAIGSFLCDQLARSGVGEITIYDYDIVKPGNLVRHLAGDSMVGMAKPQAIHDVITSRSINTSKVFVKAQSISDAKEIPEMFVKTDLVIDASADGTVTAILAKAARAMGKHLLTVCIQEEGNVVRVDIVPPLRGEPLTPTRLGPKPEKHDLRFEAGCGDPVSLTPPFAVFEAAALGARHAIGQLLNAPISNAGVIRDYR